MANDTRIVHDLFVLPVPSTKVCSNIPPFSLHLLFRFEIGSSPFYFIRTPHAHNTSIFFRSGVHTPLRQLSRSQVNPTVRAEARVTDTPCALPELTLLPWPDSWHPDS